MSPLVSVIIPLYNTSSYIEKCLRSLLRQTFRDFEIIVVDDASTDNSLAIALAVLEQSGLSYQHHTHEHNRGQSAARNKGMALAKGTYLCFVDSDDWVTTDMLALLVAKAEETGADIVAGNKILLIEGQRQAFHKHITRHEVITGNQALLNMLHGGSRVPTDNVCAKLFRKSLFDSNKLQFKEGHYFEDFIISLELFYRANRVVLLPVEIYYHNINTNSTTIQTSRKHLEDYLLLTHAFEKFCENKSVDTQAIHVRFNILSAYSTKRIFLFPGLCLEERYQFQKNLVENYRRLQQKYTFLKPAVLVHKVVFWPWFYGSRNRFAILYKSALFFKNLTSNPLYDL